MKRLIFFLFCLMLCLPLVSAGLTGGLNVNELVYYYNFDNQGPTVTNQAPANNSNVTASVVNFIYNTDESATCNLYIDGTDNNSQSATVGNNTINPTSSLVSGTNPNWYLSCVDVAGNVGNSTPFNLTVTAAPDPLAKYTFQFQQCDVTSTPKAIVYVAFIFVIVALVIFSFLSRIPILDILLGFVTVYFSWYIVSCFLFGGLLFIVLGVLLIIKGIVNTVT